MTRKRMIKLMMAIGFDRNAAARAADLCDGNMSHVFCLRRINQEIVLNMYERHIQHILRGDMTGAVAGMVGSVYG